MQRPARSVSGAAAGAWSLLLLLLGALSLTAGPLTAGASSPSSPSSAVVPTISSLLRRAAASLPGHLAKARSAVDSAADSAMYTALDTAAHAPDSLLEQLVSWLPVSTNDSITAADLALSLGYPAEAHYVTTEDGYRLRLDRMPNPGRQPVFLAHGMQTAAPSFLLLGRGKALGSLLFDAGYDVWMVNYRGTHHSQGHERYSTRDEKFWRFSLHEHGVYDNPAAIDFVLRQTGFASLLYAGHSMGCTSFMIMVASRPEYQAKVRAAFLMAPAGPLHAHRSPVVGLLYAVNNVTRPLVDRLGLHRTIRPSYLLLRRAGKLLHKCCRGLAYTFTSAIVGNNPNAAYYDLPHFFDAIPSGGSWGEIFHYEQNANRKTSGFRHYDHGAKRNVELYGTKVPPLYDVASIRTPVFMYLADNDILCTSQDTDYLRSQLRNVVRVHRATDPLFNHFDFFAGVTAPQDVLRPLLADVQTFGGPGARPANHADKDNGLGV